MDIKKLRELKKEELIKRVEDKRGELVEIIYDLGMGKESDSTKKSILKKEIARILTVLSEDSHAK